MANILTGTNGNANEQVFYGKSDEVLIQPTLVFPNGQKGTVGGGEYKVVTKYYGDPIFGMFKIPYTSVEFVPNAIPTIKSANEKVDENIGAKEQKVAILEEKAMDNLFDTLATCKIGYIDDGLTCRKPITLSCKSGDNDAGSMCISKESGFFYPKILEGGDIYAK
jgi:hypothetical protein